MTASAHPPCFWLCRSPVPRAVGLRMASYFPEAIQLAADDQAALVRALTSCEADWVFVIGPDLLPYSTLPGTRPDQFHSAGRKPMRFLSRNSVTGEFCAEHGPELWPREVLLAKVSEAGAVPEVSLVPQAMGQWYVNPSGEAAYRHAHASVARRLAGAGTPEVRRELELSASLGADAPYGHAWIAGACASLLGFPATTGQDIEDPERSRLAAADLARRVRLETAYDVRVLGAGECRLARDLCFQMPPAQIYARAARIADDGTEAGGRRARTLRAASDWLWLDQYPAD